MLLGRREANVATEMALWLPLLTLVLVGRGTEGDRCEVSVRKWNASDAAAAEASEAASAAGAGAKAACCRACPAHAICVGGNTCACAEGFSVRKDKCEPVCSPPCLMSRREKCVAPGRCDCRGGYSRNSSEACVPVCKEGCGEGEYCFAPDFCVCAPGYVNVSGSCTPVCQNGCINGHCVAPERCQCDVGFVNIHGSSNICEPACGGLNCSGHGHCDAERNACVCEDGYASLTNGRGAFACEPVCGASGCGKGGQCVAPKTCKCFPGYAMVTGKENVTCEPHCEGGCPHGVCVAPNRCECEKGYERSDDNEGACHPIGGPPSPSPPPPPVPTVTNTTSSSSTEATSTTISITTVSLTPSKTNSHSTTITLTERTSSTPTSTTSDSTTAPSWEADLKTGTPSETQKTAVSSAASTGFLEWVRGDASTCDPRCAAVAVAVTSLVIASLVMPATAALVRMLRRRRQRRRGSGGEPLWL